MTALRILFTLLVLVISLAPMWLHLTVVGPELARAGYHGMAVVSLVGAVAWYALWLRLLPSFKGGRP